MTNENNKFKKVRDLKMTSAAPDDPIYQSGYVVGSQSAGTPEKKGLQPATTKLSDGGDIIQPATSENRKGFVIIGTPDIKNKPSKPKKPQGRLPHQYPYLD
ncbi:hypothetical protein MNBD_GAMMA23-1297 [hydrothermal vent metagenome]|uniref:Uncharacterized protein n=1 Tax=hydrothermal vent metagenome TaxID=652676 RepID=A0A3B0ZUL3_9ZZZZ